MSSLQMYSEIVSQLQLQIQRPKTNVGHFYILCQHLNCKCYLINMTTTIVPCSTNIGMHGSGFKKQTFIEVVKVNKTTMMKICSFSLKYPNNQIFKTIKLINDFSETFKSQVPWQIVGKNNSTFKKTLFTSGCDLSPNSLLK